MRKLSLVCLITARLALLILTGAAASLRSGAVLFYSTDDPNYNTTPPTGALADSGWDWEGDWDGFVATAIGPQFFLTVKHVGGQTGDAFVFQNQSYPAVAFFDDPGSDLRIWQVSGTLPQFAELYAAGNESGQGVVVFGRGTQRGSPVTVASVFGKNLKGWTWGAPDGRRRWGENQIANIITAPSGSPSFGAKLLQCNFDANAGPNEADLSTGDSGGGLFIQSGSGWKLAGVNFGVDGPYNTSPIGAGFSASLFDEGGLYKGGEGKWIYTPELPSPQPGAFYAIRVSDRLSWIQNVLATPPPAAVTVLGADRVTGPYQPVSSAQVNPDAHTISIPERGGAQFYELRGGGSPAKITSVTISSGQVVLHYQ